MSDDEGTFSDPPERDLDVSALSVATLNTVYEESDLWTDLSLDDSFRTIAGSESASTPVSTPFKSGGGAQTSTQKSKIRGLSKEKEPGQDNFKTPNVPCYKACPLCKRLLKTERGYLNHMNVLKWKDAASRTPSVDTVLEFCRTQTKSVLEDVAKQTLNNDVKAIAEAATEVFCEPEWELFFCVLLTVISRGLKKCAVAMLSSIRADLQQSLSSCFSDKSFLSSLFQKCPIQSDSTTLSLFFLNLLRRFIDHALNFLCKNLSTCNVADGNGIVPSLRSKDDIYLYLSHQVIHYVAGSALRTQVQHSQCYPNNLKLQRMKECILGNFAAIGSPPILDDKDRNYWTSLMNRKSLLFVKDSAFGFFLLLAKVLILCEDSDGVRHEKVMKAVSSNVNIFNFWDSIVGNSLDEDESFSLLVKIVRAVTNTYGRGILLKRTNLQATTAQAKKATLSITHRAKIT